MKVKQFFGSWHQIENANVIEEKMNTWIESEKPEIKFITQSESNIKCDEKYMWNLTITILYS